MKKKEFIRENIEAEGYTLRVEEGVTYIEKEEKTNHSKYGECFSFFQQKIELDNEGKEIVTQTNRLYKKSENKEQNIESTELMFEGEDLTLKSLTKYLEEDGSMLYKKVENFIDKKKTIINFQKTDQLMVKSVSFSNIDSLFNDLYTEYDETGLLVREEKLIKVENIDEKKSIVTIEQNIKGDIKTTESTYIDNKLANCIWLNEKGDMTIELKINGEVEDWIYYDSNINKTIKTDVANNMQYTNQYEQVNGNSVLIKTIHGKINEEPTFIAEYTYYHSGNIKTISEENKEKEIKKTTCYKESGNIDLVIENGIEKKTCYDKFGCISYVTEVDKENGIEKKFSYNESGNISYVTEKDKESGTKKNISYNESGSISYVTEKDEKTGKSTTAYYRYDDNGNLDHKRIVTEDKNGKEIDEKYSKKRGNVTEEYVNNRFYDSIYNPRKYTTIRTIEDLKDGGKKTTEGDIVSYEYKDKKIICTYRNQYKESTNTIRKKIIEREKEKERVVVQFNIHGDWTSILRTSQNSNVPIEEFYKKGESFPTFKVEGFEIPLDSLDKYKDICKKYNIEELSEVLEAHEPKKTIESTIKSFIDFFKR